MLNGIMFLVFALIAMPIIVIFLGEVIDIGIDFYLDEFGPFN